MVYNAERQVWEGNRQALKAFDRPEPSRIGLVTNLGRANVPQVRRVRRLRSCPRSNAKTVAASFVSLSNARQVIGDMVYDPDLMVWHGNEADAARFRGLDVAPSAPAAAPATRTSPPCARRCARRCARARLGQCLTPSAFSSHLFPLQCASDPQRVFARCGGRPATARCRARAQREHERVAAVAPLRARASHADSRGTMRQTPSRVRRVRRANTGLFMQPRSPSSSWTTQPRDSAHTALPMYTARPPCTFTGSIARLHKEVNAGTPYTSSGTMATLAAAAAGAGARPAAAPAGFFFSASFSFSSSISATIFSMLATSIICDQTRVGRGRERRAKRGFGCFARRSGQCAVHPTSNGGRGDAYLDGHAALHDRDLDVLGARLHDLATRTCHRAHTIVRPRPDDLVEAWRRSTGAALPRGGTGWQGARSPPCSCPRRSFSPRTRAPFASCGPRRWPNRKKNRGRGIEQEV